MFRICSMPKSNKKKIIKKIPKRIRLCSIKKKTISIASRGVRCQKQGPMQMPNSISREKLSVYFYYSVQSVHQGYFVDWEPTFLVNVLFVSHPPSPHSFTLESFSYTGISHAYFWCIIRCGLREHFFTFAFTDFFYLTILKKKKCSKF